MNVCMYVRRELMITNIDCLFNAELQYFTFVRDPFQRFIAGFVESIHRSLHPIIDQRHPEEKLANLVGYKSAAAAHQRINFFDRDTGLFRINEEVVGMLLDKVSNVLSTLSYLYVCMYVCYVYLSSSCMITQERSSCFQEVYLGPSLRVRVVCPNLIAIVFFFQTFTE